MKDFTTKGRLATGGIVSAEACPQIHFDRMNAAADRIAPPVGYRRRIGCGCGQPMAKVSEDDAGTWTATCGCGRRGSGPTLREAREKLEAKP